MSLRLSLRTLVALVLGCFALQACTAHDCTMMYIPGVGVTVKDAQSGAAICDATITFSHDGKDEIVTKPSSGLAAPDGGSKPSCVYLSGMYGGDVRVAVSRAGYADQTQTAHVPTGDCGPNSTFDVDVSLQK
jgi:hypothetical protein